MRGRARLVRKDILGSRPVSPPPAPSPERTEEKGRKCHHIAKRVGQHTTATRKTTHFEDVISKRTTKRYRRSVRGSILDRGSAIQALSTSYQTLYNGFNEPLGNSKQDLTPGVVFRELSERFGLSHPDSAADLIRRGAKKLEQSSKAVRHLKMIEKKLKLNPESQV